jgi:hypothetical protein
MVGSQNIKQDTIINVLFPKKEKEDKKKKSKNVFGFWDVW